MTRTERRERLTISLVISLFVFAALFIATVIVGAAVLILLHYDLLQAAASSAEGLTLFVILLMLTSLVVGGVVSWLVIRMPLGPVNKLINGLDRLASGRFDTRMVPEKWYEKKLYELRVIGALTTSFNTLAKELEHTEMLRSDFINNFSHEFKTPIVSIAGFAKLLKRGNLTEEQKTEYLDIIEEESLRLSAMATNVLNLTKVENQAILTDKSEYNLSEQLRTCVLLLEAKWERKRLEPELDFEEIRIEGSEELLKEVWINLLDNAVKFAPEGSSILLKAEETPESVTVTVKNEGPDIPPEAMNKIFNKFYQADESHAAEGNGVGLAIVKRVAELHGGTVAVASSGGITSFSVTLPK
jgi:signal transduction histidine kinase